MMNGFNGDSAAILCAAFLAALGWAQIAAANFCEATDAFACRESADQSCDTPYWACHDVNWNLLGIGDKASSVPGVLSGGQRQRLAIARALANEPTLLLADEPTGALDTETGAQILKVIRRVRDERGTTVLLVTNDDGVAVQADRVLRLRDGVLDAIPAAALRSG